MSDLDLLRVTRSTCNPPRKRHILIVDDEPAVRGALKMMLSAENFQVAEAGDGLEAIESLRDTPADVVLLDLKMPRLGGMAALREIRRNWPETKVIAFSGEGIFAFESPLDMALVAGANHMIEKPVCRDRLLTAIKLVLR